MLPLRQRYAGMCEVYHFQANSDDPNDYIEIPYVHTGRSIEVNGDAPLER